VSGRETSCFQYDEEGLLFRAMQCDCCFAVGAPVGVWVLVSARWTHAPVNVSQSERISRREQVEWGLSSRLS
jgi:hypothetical protein